jgi:hypothetical protein
VSSAVLHDRAPAKEIGLIIIGIDPHKPVHTVSAATVAAYFSDLYRLSWKFHGSGFAR